MDEVPFGDLDLPDEIDADLFQRCVEIFRETAGTTRPVKITLTSDFLGQVQAALPDPEEAERYTVERLTGEAGAKVIDQPDGSVIVVVNVGHVLKGSDVELAEATFLHEALHVLLKNMNETTHSSRLDGLEAEGVSEHFVAIAGVTAEEVRVEKVVRARYPHSDEPSLKRDFLGDQAVAFYDRARVASMKYQRDRDVQSLMQNVISGFSDLATSCGYLAADLLASDSKLDDLEFSEALHFLVLGERWQEVMATLMTIPPATERLRKGALDSYVRTLAGQLEAWLIEIGFKLEDTSDGYGFWISSPEQWAFDLTIERDSNDD